ncbi:MAG TPA: 23S rRNA (uracil(1939)-C(5))-methyltransferase RlmD [Lachnospiraceae bacterium]
MKKEKVIAICPYTKRCGGCDFQGIDYKEQLKKKKKILEKCLGKYGKIETVVSMENPKHYRNKVSAAFGREKNGKIISGTYEEKSHRIVPIETCMIENEKADEIIGTIRELAKSFKIKIYNEDTGYGLLRHVLVRVGSSSGEIMVVLIVASPIFPSKNNFVKVLRNKHPEITTVVLNINNRSDSMVLGDREIVLYGKGYIKDSLCGVTFRISSRSFYQINSVQTEKLYQKAIDFADLKGKETLIDAYCGIGTIGLIAAKTAKQVIGVELNQDAVKDAIANARENTIKNARFYRGDAGDFMVNMASRGEKADIVFMDPPRSGSSQKFLNSLSILSPKRVVYISCNPESQKRDLEYLIKKGYKVKKMIGYDMFPFTLHIESVVLLTKVHN